jgi:hypothetical protein
LGICGQQPPVAMFADAAVRVSGEPSCSALVERGGVFHGTSDSSAFELVKSPVTFR